MGDNEHGTASPFGWQSKANKPFQVVAVHAHHRVLYCFVGMKREVLGPIRVGAAIREQDEINTGARDAPINTVSVQRCKLTDGASRASSL